MSAKQYKNLMILERQFGRNSPEANNYRFMIEKQTGQSGRLERQRGEGLALAGGALLTPEQREKAKKYAWEYPRNALGAFVLGATYFTIATKTGQAIYDMYNGRD